MSWLAPLPPPILLSKNSELKNKISELEKEKEQLQMRLNCGAPTDGLEVGSPEDYGDAPIIYESPDGGKTIYQRKAGDYENRTKVEDSKQLKLDFMG